MERSEENKPGVLTKEKYESAVKYAEEHIPKLHRGLFLRTAKGYCAPRDMIKAMCQHCVGYENMKEMIGECSPVIHCPLWRERPYRNNNEDE